MDGDDSGDGGFVGKTWFSPRASFPCEDDAHWEVGKPNSAYVTFPLPL